MVDFEAMVIDKDSFRMGLSEDTQLEKFAKNKHRTSIDLGMAAVAYIKYCRHSSQSSPDLKRYLLKFMELEELMDRFYSRSHFNVDIECKITRYMNANREELVSFTDWMENMISEQETNYF